MPPNPAAHWLAILAANRHTKTKLSEENVDKKVSKTQNTDTEISSCLKLVLYVSVDTMYYWST